MAHLARNRRRWWLIVPPVAALHLAARRGIPARLALRLPPLAYAFGCGVVSAVLLSFAAGDYQPFIYFQF